MLASFFVPGIQNLWEEEVSNTKILQKDTCVCVRVCGTERESSADLGLLLVLGGHGHRRGLRVLRRDDGVRLREVHRHLWKALCQRYFRRVCERAAAHTSPGSLGSE